MRVGPEVRYDQRRTLCVHQLIDGTPAADRYTIEFRNTLELRSEGDRVDVRCIDRDRRCFLSDATCVRDQVIWFYLGMLILECCAVGGVLLAARRFGLRALDSWRIGHPNAFRP